jgi:general secretion pathway protein M
VTSLPDGRSGKALALAIAAVVILSFYFVAVAPVLAFYDSNAVKLEDRRQMLARYEAAKRDLPALRTQAQNLAAQSGETSTLFSAPSDAVAAANVQSMLKDLVEAGGAKLATTQTLPAEARGNLRRVGVRISFSGDMTLVTGVLVGIDAARPALAIGGLELHSGGGKDGQTLTVAMDVYGFRAQDGG